MSDTSNQFTVVNGQNTDASAVITEMLNSYGLGSLVPWALQQIQAGATPDEIAVNMRQTPQFQQEFGVISQRQKAGLPPISVQDVIDYRNTAAQLRAQYGISDRFFTKADADALLAKDISPTELEARFRDGYDAVAKAPPEVQQAFANYFGPNSQQAMVQFFIDPDKAEPLLTQEAQAAIMGGTGSRYGIDLSEQEAMNLAQAGVSADRAQTGFNDIDKLSALYQTDVGDTVQLSKAQGVEADLLGNAQMISAQQQKLGERAATSQGRVGVEENPQKGFQGLGEGF